MKKSGARVAVWCAVYVAVALTLIAPSDMLTIKDIALAALATGVAVFAIGTLLRRTGALQQNARGRTTISGWLAIGIIGVYSIHALGPALAARWSNSDATGWVWPASIGWIAVVAVLARGGNLLSLRRGAR
jgi:hypothetical protein